MYNAAYIKHTLQFHKPAGTSRGILTEKNSWYILLSKKGDPELRGIGECSIIPGLSIDDFDDFEIRLDHICKLISSGEMPVDQDLPATPSIQFGLETALLDLNSGGQRLLFASGFTEGTFGIPVNGLIWMGEKQSMLDQITKKIEQGFSVLKMKVGALKFHDELEILNIIRTRFDKPDLEIRLDANGGWSPHEALDKIDRLSEYHIHSIEQPVSPGQINEMARVCKVSPVDIALDEELIGVSGIENKKRILEVIRPAYVIIKPGLLGGFSVAEDWIKLADAYETGWWVTSALESNIGLNAISQWTAKLNTNLPQGLGTGGLFTNNIPSPLRIIGDQLFYDQEKKWDVSGILGSA